MKDSLTQRLAAAAAAPFFCDEALLDRARLLLYDYRVCARRGAAADSSLSARRALASETTGGGATLEGMALRATPRTAALLNALAAHAIEMDDTHEPGSLHPGVVVWPAAIAVGEETGASPRQVLEAGIAGYGVMCHLAQVLGGAAAYKRGFHPTGICGSIGAAAAAGRVLGLDPAAMSHALGTAATSAAGSMEYLSDGAWTKRLNPGLAASNGILAAQLAAAGFRGPSTALHGRFGFLHAFGDLSSTTRTDIPLDITAGIRETSIKLYPCCRYMHPCMDLLIDLTAQYQLTPAHIEAVGCGVLSAGVQLIAEPLATKRAPASQVDAQFSMPFGAALALTRGGAGLEDFEDAPRLSAQMASLMRRVECFTSPALDAAYPQFWGGEAWVRLADGVTLEARTPSPRGSPAFPASWQDVQSKAANLIGTEAAAHLALQCRSYGAGGTVRRTAGATPA